MSREISLLSKIKSKYILKDLLSLAYYDINSIIKLVKYNKSLLNKLDINIKTIDKLNNYKLQTKKNIKIIKIRYFWIIIIIIFHPEGIGIILLLIYIIFFYKKGKFTDDILEKGYNERKKKFVDSMDKYLLIPYTIIIYLFLLLIYSFYIFPGISRKFSIKGVQKFLFLVFYLFLALIYYIINIIKFIFSENIIKENYLKILRSGKTNHNSIKILKSIIVLKL